MGEIEFRARPNFVLVQNVYDDTLWVIWEKYVYSAATSDSVLSKGIVEPYQYGRFPRMEDLDAKVLYAKLADTWDTLGFDAHLSLERIYRVPDVGRGGVGEPVVTYAVRTD